MPIFRLSRATRIEADASRAPIANAVAILRRDIRDLLTDTVEENAIVVTIDDSLPREHYEVTVTESAMTLRCGDDLGAVYCCPSVSAFWASRRWVGGTISVFHPRPFADVPCGSYTTPEYAVRFRGWFINDEVLLNGWKDTEEDRRAMWKRIFETILRCGGNMVIPGTDRAHDGELLNAMALDMGLWLTQHHTEILGARMFARVYPDLPASYTLHQDKFEALWQEAIDRYARRRVLWCVGFRGQGDRAFWHSDPTCSTDEARGAFISRVIERQIEMVRAKDPDARFSTNLYGEMMDLYRKGYLKVPEGVIKLWGDNGYGRMVSRRQDNLNPRVDAMPGTEDPGPHGIYYHVAFYDLQAANHITMLQEPPEQIVQELTAVIQHGGDECWNVNVGSIKPHIFMLELIRRTWTEETCDVGTMAADYARTYYGTADVAPLLTSYADCAVPYGPNTDDRAGDQFYHFPLRYLAHALLRGETNAALSSLYWAGGNESFSAQVEAIGRMARGGIASWRQYVRRCQNGMDGLTDHAARLLSDTLLLQGILHLTGCEGLHAFCQACAHFLRGDELQAYRWTDQALQAEREGLAALRRAEHGRFANIYRNECFSNVALSAQVMESVRGYLRVRGDGNNLYAWEKRYLTLPEENLVVMQTHRTNQLTDDELCRRLQDVVPLIKAF